MNDAPLTMRRSGRGHPVVFIGGSPTNWDVCEPLARALASTHECIELALPGYGASPPLTDPYTVPRAQEAVEQRWWRRCGR